MISINFSLKNLDDIFKVNWIIGFLVFLSPFLFLPLFFLDLFNLPLITDNFTKQDIMFSRILQIDIVYTVVGLLLSIFIIRVGRYFSIFLLFYFFAFFFFYFSYLATMFSSFHHSDNKINLEFTCLLSIVTSLFGSIIYLFFCRYILNNPSKNYSILVLGLILYIILNIGGAIRVVQFNYPAAILFIGITSFYFLLYRYGQRFILIHFKWFTAINIVLLFIPFYISYFYELSYYDMSYLWSFKCYSDLCNDIVYINLPEHIQYLILFLNPYQLVVFPLYFSFNAYIIAKKMNEVKDGEKNNLVLKN